MTWSLVLLLASSLVCVVQADIGCAARKVDLGYVCVCNETYCDTVERPTVLKFPSFTQYSTAESDPGFTRTEHIVSEDALQSPDPDLDEGTSEVTVSVNASQTYQVFKGIGTALTDTAGMLIQTLTPATQDKFAESVFGETGVEMTLIRLPIAFSDFSPRHYSYDDISGDVDLKYWNLTSEDFDIKIPLLKKFQSIYKRKDGIKILSGSWSAPNWMKTNNGALQGYLRNQYRQAWADYHVKFLQAYEKAGISIWGISLGNEVILPLYFGTFFSTPNTILTPNQARDFVKNYLAPALKNNGYDDVKLYSLDDERPFITWWSDRLLKDKEVADRMSGVTIHWYSDTNLTIKTLEDHHKNHPDQDLMYTESSINTFQSASGQAVDYGSWDSGVRYINNIFQNLCHWVTAYVDWNVALNRDGGPATMENITLDASIIINQTISEFYKQPIFYVLGHFSKFIQPGGYRVQALVKQTSDDPWSEECYSVPVTSSRRARPPAYFQAPAPAPAALSATTESPFPTRKPDPPSNTVLVLAVSNPDGSRSIITYNPRTTTAKLVVRDVDKPGKKFTAKLQPHSMNTFVYW